MMAELLEGQPLAQVQQVAERFAALLAGDADAARDPLLGDLRAMAEVARFPVRARCARLPFEALDRALQQATPTEIDP